MKKSESPVKPRNRSGKIDAPSIVLGLACGIILLAGGWLLGSRSNSDANYVDKNTGETVKLSGKPFKHVDNTVADIAQNASSSVVNIDISKKQKMQVPEFFFFAPPGFKHPKGEFEREFKGTGSGIIIRSNGYIVTNNHVVGSADDIKVTVKDKTYKGKVKGRDRFTDLAIVKIDAQNLPVAKLGTSKNLRPGEWAIAIGSPMGLDHTVTLGIISALDRSLTELSDIKLIQTDAAINPGNSGGPLLDIKGNVIGLNTAIKNHAQNIGFAIPVDLVKEVSDQLIEKGKISRPYVGILMQEMTPKLAKSLGHDSNTKGVVIAGVKPDSPASKAGIEQGDILQRINGKEVLSSIEVQKEVRKHKPDEKLTFLVLRNNKLVPMDVKIGEFPNELK